MYEREKEREHKKEGRRERGRGEKKETERKGRLGKKERGREGEKGKKSFQLIHYLGLTVMLLLLNWLGITQDCIELSLNVSSYLLCLILFLMGLHYESPGEEKNVIPNG